MDLLQTVLALFASPVQQHAPSPPVQDVLERIVAAQPRRRSALADAALHEEQQVAHAQAQHLPPTDPGPPAPCGPLANPHTVQPCPVPIAPRHHPRSSTDTSEACSIDAAGSDNVLGAQAPAQAEHAARDDSQNHHHDSNHLHDSNHPSSNTTQATGSHTSSKAQPQLVNTCSAHQQMPQLTSHPVECIPASPNAGAQLHRAASHQQAAQSQAASPSPPSPSPSPAPRSTPKKSLASPSPPSPSPSPVARTTPKKAPAAAATAATAPARARPAAKPKRKPKNAEEFLRQQMSGIRRQKAQASSSKATTAGAAREGRKPAVAAEARQRQQQQQKQAAAHGLPQGLQQLNSPPSVSMGEANEHGPDQHAPGDGAHERRAAGQAEKKKRGPENADAHAGCVTKKRGRRSKQQRELAGLEVHTGLTASSGSSSSSSSSNGERDDGVEVGGGWGTGTDSIVAEDAAVPAQHAWGSGCSAPQSRGAQAAQQKGKQQQQQQQQQAELAKHQRLQQHQQRQQQQQQSEKQQQKQNQQQQQQQQRQEEQQKHQEQQQQQQGEATDEEDESGSRLGDLLHLSFGQLQQQRAQLPSAHLHPPPLVSKQQQQQRQPLVSPAKSAPPTKPPQQAHPAVGQQRMVQPAADPTQRAAGEQQAHKATAEQTQEVAAAEQAQKEAPRAGAEAASAVTARSSVVSGHEGRVDKHAKQQASQQGIPPQSAPAKGVATGKAGVPHAPANRSQGGDSHLHVHVPIGLGIQGPKPADLAASHQEAMKLREQQAEALERERLGLNMKPITSQPAPSTKPQVQARRAQLQQQQQQQLSQQSHSLASTQTSFSPHQTPAIFTPQLQQQQQQQQPWAPTPKQQQQQQQQQQPQKQQPPVPSTQQQQQQQQQPRLTELQKFRHLQQQSGPERFGLLHKAGFKSHQPPRKGGQGPGGAQGGAPGGAQREQSGGTQGGQPGGVQGLAGKGGQAAAGGGPAGKGPGPGPTGIVSDPRLLRTLERYHHRTHDACTDAEGLKAANLAWAEAMRDGADELDAALPAVPPSGSAHAAAAAPAAAAPAAAAPPASAAAAPAAALPSSAAAPKAAAPSAAAAAMATAPVTAAAAAPAAAARTTAVPSSAAATPAAATPSSAAAGICAQSAKTHAPDAAATGPDEGGGAVNIDEDDGAMEHAGSRFEGGESESEGSEEGEGAARGRSSRRRGKSGTGIDLPRPPHKRVLSLGKGPPGHSPGPNATVVEVGLYADIKAHIKEGKKRSKQAYQFAQEHPDLAPPPKKRRPTYEVQQKAVCRYWLFGTCKNAGCTFKHEGQPVPKRLIPCEFHVRGACKSGASCSFSHSLENPPPCKQLILEGSCPRNGHCSFGHDFSPEDSQLLFEYFSFSEERQQRAMAAKAAAVPDAPVPVMQPPPINNACFSSQGDAYIPPLQVGGEAEVEEI